MGACAGGGRGLLNISWRMVEMAAGLLEPKEREVVLGDMQEGGEASWRGVPEVLGLYIRRQALLWRNWQPWLAAFGVALPTSFLLMGFSLSVSYEFLRFAGPQGEPGRAMDPSLPVFAGNLLLLVGWAWAGGFVVGSLSRRTLWASLFHMARRAYSASRAFTTIPRHATACSCSSRRRPWACSRACEFPG